MASRRTMRGDRVMRKQGNWRRAAALLLGLAWQGTAAQARAAETLDQVLADYWDWTLQENPVLATQQGNRRYDDRLGAQSPDAIDRTFRALQGFQDRLKAVDASKTSTSDRLNRDILARDLDIRLRGARFPQRFLLFTNRWGWHVGFAALPQSVPLFTLADYKSYIARLNDYRRFNAEGVESTRRALELGVNQPCVSMVGFERSISGHIVSNVEQSVFWQPMRAQPGTIAAADWQALQAQARAAIQASFPPTGPGWRSTLKRWRPSAARRSGQAGCRKGPTTTPGGWRMKPQPI
jgi:uncharacterized protein (DUF885 family)